jgi:hypothetical protein
MNARRSSTKATIRLETLEDRITPAVLDPTLIHLAANRAVLLGPSHGAFDSESGPRLNLIVKQGHRQILVTASTNPKTLYHNTPSRIHPSFGAVSPVENPAPAPAPVITEPILRSTTLPVAPPTRPVAQPQNPVVTPTVPLDPDGGVGSTPAPSNPPAGPTTTTPAPLPVITEPVLR